MELTSIVVAVAPSLLSGVILWKLKERAELDNVKEEEQEAKHQALVLGVNSLLRERLIDASDFYRAAGWIPQHKADVLTAMYQAYHGLGGNGLVTAAYKELLKLPHSKPGE